MNWESKLTTNPYRGKMEEELTLEEANAIFNSNIWKQWSDRKKIGYQMGIKHTLMPQSEYLGALSRVLEREVKESEIDSKTLEAEINDVVDAEKDAVVLAGFVRIYPRLKQKLCSAGLGRCPECKCDNFTHSKDCGINEIVQTHMLEIILQKFIV